MSPPWTPENSHPWSSLEGETKNDSNLWSFGKYCLLLFLPALLKNFPWVTVTLGNGIYCMWMKLLSLLVRVPKTNCWIKATDGKCVSESYVSSHKCHCDFGTVKTHSFPIRITDVEVILSLQILENCLMLKHVGSGPPGNPYWGNIIIFFFFPKKDPNSSWAQRCVTSFLLHKKPEIQVHGKTTAFQIWQPSCLRGTVT